MRLLAIATSVVAVAALVAGGVVLAQRNSATRERDEALLAALVADARAAAVAQPDTAMLLAVEAHAESATPETAGAVVDALLARPSAHVLLRAESSTVQAIALTGGAIATTSGNEVQLWTEDGWQQTGGFAVDDGDIADVTLTEDGETLLAAIPDDHLLVAVDARTGRPAADPVSYGVMRPVRVVTAGDRALVQLDTPADSSLAPRVEQHDLRTLERVGPSLVPPEGGVVEAVAASTDGRAALASSDGTVWLADLDTGELDLGVSAPAGDEQVGVVDLAWHDDLLVAGRLDGTVDAWRADPRGHSDGYRTLRRGGSGPGRCSRMRWVMPGCRDGRRPSRRLACRQRAGLAGGARCAHQSGQRPRDHRGRHSRHQRGRGQHHGGPRA